MSQVGQLGYISSGNYDAVAETEILESHGSR